MKFYFYNKFVNPKIKLVNTRNGESEIFHFFCNCTFN